MLKRELEGFGSLGVELPELDWNGLDGPSQRALGELSRDQLVAVVRAAAGRPSLERFHEVCASWAEQQHGGGYERSAGPEHMTSKYGGEWAERDEATLSADDRSSIEDMNRMRTGVEHLPGMIRITGMRDEDGHHLGMFADGELGWHSNQQGTQHYLPVVALLAWEGAGGSCTEFLNTVDAYDDLSPEWRKRCDELVALHSWETGKIAPGLNGTQERILKMNMCPDDNAEVPLVAESPGGRRGLHFPFTTIVGFKGVEPTEADEIVRYLIEHCVQDRYVYSHRWTDGDVVIFDNAVTLHRRPTKDCSTRVMYRMCFNYDAL